MPSPLTTEARTLRSDLAELTGLAFADLGIVWRSLRTPDDAKDALNDIIPSLVSVYGAAAGTLSADWYDDLRDVSGAGRRFRAIVPEVPDAGAAALTGYGVGPLYAREPDWASALTLTQGGIQRRIANVSRLTVTGSSVEDPSTSGWVRVGEGECKSGWCDQFLDGVVRSVAYDFRSHDWCRCTAIPSFF